MAKEGQRVVALAVDGSHHALDAFDYYVANLCRPNDFLAMIHVQEAYDYTSASPATIDKLKADLKKESEEIQAKYEAARTKAQIDGGFFVENSKPGKPGQAVVEFAEDKGASMIVTGTRGMGTIRRTIMGSVSDYIIHHSDVPVLVCRLKGQKK